MTFSRRRERLAELIGLLTFAALACVLIGSAMPALGALATYAVPDHGRAAYVVEIEAIRSGNLRLLDFDRMTGVVTFPSLLAAIRLIVIWVTRDWLPAHLAALAVNIPLMVGAPVFGRHYLIDILGGTILTLFAGLALRFIASSGVDPLLHSRRRWPGAGGESIDRRGRGHTPARDH